MPRSRLAYLLLALGAAAPIAAAGPHPADATRRLPLQLDTAAAGELIEVEGSEERAELLTFGAGLVDGLLLAGFEEEVRVADWPVAPGERADVRLVRRDVYAPDAVIWEVTEEGRREVPRSKLAFLWGTAERDEDVRVMVSVDPETRELRGFSNTLDGMHELQPTPAGVRDLAGQHVLGPSGLFLDAAEREGAGKWRCDQVEVPEPLRSISDQLGDGPRRSTAAAISTLHTASIAVDTDNEIMLNKFANNTTNATNYIASLFAAMNITYERDLLVRLLVGTTVLRTNPPSADPYVVANWPGPEGADFNNFDKLLEFTNYWATNQGAVTRALALLLSGRGGGGTSAAGVAWVNVLCSTSLGYAFSRVQQPTITPSTLDIMVTAHELGHNFGSPHTHCYNRVGLAFPDQCFSGEFYACPGGVPGPGCACYSGATSCPTSGTVNGVPNTTGTLMSYCHFLGAGCTTSAQMMVFHDLSETLLDPLIENRTPPFAGGNACIFQLAPTISSIVPNRGPIAGGTVVTITGTNFVPGTTLTIGGTPPTSFNVDNATQITATTAAKPTGTATVVVTHPNTETATTSFFYHPPPTAADFHTVAPCRVIDTRLAVGPLGGPVMSAGQQRVFVVDGVCGIPHTAKALAVNVTVANAAAAGAFQIYPGNAFPLGINNLSFNAAVNRAAMSIVTLDTNTGDTDVSFGVLNSATGNAHLIVDVNGYFE